MYGKKTRVFFLILDSIADELNAMPFWVRERSGAPKTQQEFAATVLPALKVDKVYLFPEGVLLCGVCHTILPGIDSVHNHFNTESHRSHRTPRVRELRRCALSYQTRYAVPSLCKF